MTRSSTTRSSGRSRGPAVGVVLTVLVALFLTVDTALKVLALAPAVEGTTALGYPAASVVPIGIIELVCLVLYLVPRTSVLGAILLTGYLGGAVATHVRVGSPLPTHTLFPLYVGAMLWGGLYLRERHLHAVLPFRRGDRAEAPTSRIAGPSSP
jgi:hypothetical protein